MEFKLKILYAIYNIYIAQYCSKQFTLSSIAKKGDS